LSKLPSCQLGDAALEVAMVYVAGGNIVALPERVGSN